MKIKRREFLKTGVVVGAAVGLAGPTLNAFAHESNEEVGTAPGRWLTTSCQGCTTWCPAEVFVQDGRATKMRGNRLSKQNEGFLCPKGPIALQELYDPDRLKSPMKRTNPKKGRGVDPKFVPISWDEALNTIADKMMELRNNKEPQKFMLMRGRYSYMNETIYEALPKIFGTPNNISHSSICAEAEKAGSFFTAGNWDYRDYDIANTKYLLIWGADPLSSNRQIPATIRKFGDVRGRATIAVVDPRLSSSGAKAHEWMPIKPGEDGALAVAIAHVLLTEGLWNREFVGDFKDGKNQFVAGKTVDEAAFAEKETHGLVKWWNIELKDKTAGWAAEKTLIPADQILRVARGLGKASPAACVWMGPGAAMHVRGTYTAMAVHALNGLLGSIDSKGGVLAGSKIPANKIPAVDAYLDELAKQKHKKIDQRGDKAFPVLSKGKPGGGVVTNNAANGMLQKKPNEIKVAIGYMNNFPFSCTGADRWEKAMEQLPFFAHITTMAAEITQYADIVLPSRITTFEKLGFVKSKANRYGTASLIQPVVDPLWDVRTDETEIPFQLAVKLKERGFSNLYDYYYNEFKDPETGAKPQNGEQFGLYSLKIQTAPLWDGKEDVGGDKIRGWVDYQTRGMWNSDEYKYKARWGGKFGTKTKKFEFYSETLKASLGEHAEKHKTSVDDILQVCNYEARGEMAFVPHYEAPFRHGSIKEYPFTFVDYKSRLNREGRSANCTWYMEFKKVDVGDRSWQDVVQMNPEDAAKLGIKDGQKVKLTSTAGTIEARARLWEGVRPGTIAKSYGQGHWAYGSVASDYKKARPKGGNNNELMPDDYDRLSGSTVRNGGFTGVKISKA